MTKCIFDLSTAELNAIAKEAVREAVAELHAKGISTYHMEDGKMIETAPDGTRRERPANRLSKLEETAERPTKLQAAE